MLSRRVYALTIAMLAGFDARIGWEPHLRLNGTLGIRLGQ